MKTQTRDEPIKIIVTGGTFDKEYDELTGNLFFKKTHVPEMLQLGRSRSKISIQTLMMIDSLEMTDIDRIKILKACQKSKEKRMVITHGTDTLEITAKFLGKNLSKLSKKVIILTGAMIPYKFGSSDGLFNLGASIAFAQSIDPGVYVAMNGKLFHWNQVTKNRKKGEFIEK